MSLVFLESFDFEDLYAKGWLGNPSTVAGRTGRAIILTGIGGVTLPLYTRASSTITVGIALYSGAPSGSGVGPSSLLNVIDFGGYNQVVIDVLMGLHCAGGPCGNVTPYAWHYVECTTVTGGSGHITVAVDGVQTYTGSVSLSTGLIDHITLGDTYDFDWSPQFDDMYITNGAGSVNTGMLGDVRVAVMLPDGNGDLSEFENSNGNFTNNYTYVNSPIAQTTTFVASDTPGDEDAYQMADMPWPAGNIAGVQACILSAKDNAATRQIEPVVRIAGTDYVGAATALALSPVYATSIWEQDPATSAAWTVTSINSTQLGARVE